MSSAAILGERLFVGVRSTPEMLALVDLRFFAAAIRGCSELHRATPLTTAGALDGWKSASEGNFSTRCSDIGRSCGVDALLDMLEGCCCGVRITVSVRAAERLGSTELRDECGVVGSTLAESGGSFTTGESMLIFAVAEFCIGSRLALGGGEPFPALSSSSLPPFVLMVDEWTGSRGIESAVSVVSSTALVAVDCLPEDCGGGRVEAVTRLVVSAMRSLISDAKPSEDNFSSAS